MIQRAAVTATLVLAACGGGQPKEWPQATFALPADTVLTRYVNVPAAAALGGARWVVASPEFNEAAIVDFTTRSVRVLRGKGEAEVRNPYGVFAAGDTAFVTDWALQRMTKWSATGEAAGAVAAPAGLRGLLPSARDAAGNYYFLVKPAPGRDGSGNRDSAAVVRSPADFARFDTVARLSPLDLAEVDQRGSRRFERRVFSGEDHWGVFADGTVWVARVYQNYVLRRNAVGKETRGERLPDRVIEVTWSDRDHFLLQFPEDQRSTAEMLPWAPLKPPFENAIAAPGGWVWLEKSRPAVDSVRTYQVISPSGALSHLVVYPSRQGHVVALTDSLALVAEQFKEGVRLMQVAIPATPPPIGKKR
jgi:hypothetical protein